MRNLTRELIILNPPGLVRLHFGKSQMPGCNEFFSGEVEVLVVFECSFFFAPFFLRTNFKLGKRLNKTILKKGISLYYY